jgi:hypothetical protein
LSGNTHRAFAVNPTTLGARVMMMMMMMMMLVMRVMMMMMMLMMRVMMRVVIMMMMLMMMMRVVMMMLLLMMMMMRVVMMMMMMMMRVVMMMMMMMMRVVMMMMMMMMMMRVVMMMMMMMMMRVMMRVVMMMMMMMMMMMTLSYPLTRLGLPSHDLLVLVRLALQHRVVRPFPSDGRETVSESYDEARSESYGAESTGHPWRLLYAERRHLAGACRPGLRARGAFVPAISTLRDGWRERLPTFVPPLQRILPLPVQCPLLAPAVAQA